MHAGKDLCFSPTPAPSPATLCPAEAMPLPGWHDACLNGDLLFSSDSSGGLWPEVGACLTAREFALKRSDVLCVGLLGSQSMALAQVGNGFVATVVQSDSIFSAGLFNGPDSDNTHRARIPAIDFAPFNRGGTSLTIRTGRGLDVLSGVFTQVSTRFHARCSFFVAACGRGECRC